MTTRLAWLIAVLTSVITLPDRIQAQEPKKKNSPIRLTTVEVKTRNEVYKKTPEGELVMHLFFPADWKATDKRPVMVFFFGGGWKNGSYTQFVPQAEYFASRGLVTASADYRIESKHKTTPDRCVEDAKSAVRWLRSRAGELGIDPEKVIASGGSAGGHLAAATALVEGFDAKGDPAQSCKPNALVLFNPALNLSGGKRTITDAQNNDITKLISPTLYLKKSTPPAIIFFGTSDAMLVQGEEYRKRAKELGVRAELYTAAEQPHGFFNRAPWIQVTTHKADEFLISLGYLKDKPTLMLPASAPSLKAVD